MQIPIRIIDGLYLGDQNAAHDLEFLVTNKITKIINCAAKHIPNHWESIGIDYLTYHWLESETNFPIDHSRCFTFINDAIDTGEAVLVHSIKAHNRSIFIICVFLMRKFKWSLQKTLQFITNLKQDLELKQNILIQLVNFEKWLHNSKLSNNWDYAQNEDEVVARNTYLNSQRTYSNEPRKRKDQKSKQVSWSKKIVSEYIPSYFDIQFKKFSTPQPKSQPSQISIKLKVLPSDNWINKKFTLNQLVDEQLQKKMNIFTIKSDRQQIKPTITRPGTAPSKRLIKTKQQSQSHRILVRQS